MSKPFSVAPYIFLLPAACIISLFMLYPMVSAIILSFTEYNMIQDAKFVGIDQYKRLFADPFFWNGLGNTLLYVIVVVPILSLLPIFVAVLVNSKLPGIKVFRVIYYLPVVTSLVVTGLMWKWVYEENGVLNYILQGIGLIAEPIAWLAEPSISLFAVMAVTVWTGMGFYMVIYLAGLQSIPQALYEVAELEGIGKFKQTLFITIPLLRHYIAVVAIMSSIAAMKIFEEVYIMTGGGPLSKTETLVFFIYDNAFVEFEMGYASAAGVILFTITLLLSIVNLFITRAK